MWSETLAAAHAAHCAESAKVAHAHSAHTHACWGSCESTWVHSHSTHLHVTHAAHSHSHSWHGASSGHYSWKSLHASSIHAWEHEVHVQIKRSVCFLFSLDFFLLFNVLSALLNLFNTR